MSRKRKFNKTVEWVIEEYINKKRPRKEVAEECGLSESGFQSFLKENNIIKGCISFNIKREELETLINDNKNIKEICEYFNCSKSVINRKCKEFSLKIKEHVKYEQYDSSNDEMIISLYNDGLSSTQIAKVLNKSHRSILNHLIKCNIKRRTLSESQWNFNNKEKNSDLDDYGKMYDLYINQKLSKKDLSEKYGCSARVIDKALKKLKIKVRNNSESKIGLMINEKHPNWKGGICLLYFRLRTYFKIHLMRKAVERDNHICQKCGSSENLHVHHIKPFKEIVNRICSEHSNLDLIKDVNELFNIIIKDDEFLSLDNLITLCKDCHYKEHGYDIQK